MKCNAERLIEALISAQMLEYEHRQHATQQQADKPLVVTISRECGSYGKAVAQELANTLGVRCCDRSILHEVARRAHVDEELVAVLDEHVSHIQDHWWQKLLHPGAMSYDQYYHHLVKTVMSISRSGGVIVGRGANIILGPDRAFRVRITGSQQKCAEFIARRDNIDITQAMIDAMQANQERAEYIRLLYNTDINDLRNYDLVINADRYDQQQTVSLIVFAMKHAGYDLPASTAQALAGAPA